MLILWVSSALKTAKTHKGCYYIMWICLELVNLSAGQSSNTNRIMLRWLLIHKSGLLLASFPIWSCTYIFIWFPLYEIYFILKAMYFTYHWNNLLNSRSFTITFSHIGSRDTWSISIYYFTKMSKLCPSEHIWLESCSMMWQYQLAIQLWDRVTVRTYSNACHAHVAIIFPAMELAALHNVYARPKSLTIRVLKVFNYTKNQVNDRGGY